ncbi:hypothetical protein Ahu01nite_036410 [Winogradskya humida]|uniref:Uncharacterized protein n=1 Tax=Winogradskya humida TaxID=113566 RepID=A0ABQ3ZPM4_9ACTN|nr:hypothetical protein Ahu01nite_036410 [Actinoplanes humidus]
MDPPGHEETVSSISMRSTAVPLPLTAEGGDPRSHARLLGGSSGNWLITAAYWAICLPFGTTPTLRS